MGNLRQYPGNYSVYLDYKQVEAAEASQIANSKEKQKQTQPQIEQTEAKPQNNSKKRNLSSWEKREFEQLEGKIAQLESEKAKLEKTLYNSPPGGYTEVQKLSERLESLNKAIDTATERWIELAEVELKT